MIVPSGILDKVEPPSVEPPSSGGEGGKVCNRRVSHVAPRRREGPLTEPIAGAQPRPQERVLTPLSCHSRLARAGPLRLFSVVGRPQTETTQVGVAEWSPPPPLAGHAVPMPR